MQHCLRVEQVLVTIVVDSLEDVNYLLLTKGTRQFEDLFSDLELELIDELVLDLFIDESNFR